MPAMFESGFFGNNQPFWHGQGTVIPEDVVTMERVLQLVPDLGQIVREVEVWAVLGAGKGFKIPDMKARYRADGAYLGTVGKDNGLIQNAEAMDFMDETLGRGGAHYHTAGVLNGGRECWVQARKTEPIVIDGDPTSHAGFISALNSFDGSRPVMVIVGEERIGCHNTFLGAIGSAKDRFIFKHTGLVRDRVQAAIKTVATATDHWSEYRKLGAAAIRTQFSDKQFMHCLDELVPLPSLHRLDYDPEAHKRIEANAESERDAVKLIWMDSPTMADFRGTAWAAINTFTEYLDHHTRSRTTTKSDQAQNRMKRILFDTSFREKAVNLVRQSAELVSLS